MSKLVKTHAIYLAPEILRKITEDKDGFLLSDDFEYNIAWIEQHFKVWAGDDTTRSHLIRQIKEIVQHVGNSSDTTQVNERAVRLVSLLKNKTKSESLLPRIKHIKTPLEIAEEAAEDAEEIRASKDRWQAEAVLFRAEPVLRPLKKMMDTGQECAIQDVILRARKEILKLLREAPTSGTTLVFGNKVFTQSPDELIKQIYDIFMTMKDAMQDDEGKVLTNVMGLYNLAFGDGTRPAAWLHVQTGGPAGILRGFDKALRALDSITQAAPVIDPVQVVVNAETQLVRKLCLALPFLARMVESDNFNEKDRQAIRNFILYLEKHRKEFISLEMDSVTTAAQLLTLYNKPTFFLYEQRSMHLAEHFQTKIKALMIRAIEMDQDKSDRFHLHFDHRPEVVGVCLGVLEELDQINIVTQLIRKKMPDSVEKTNILDIRQQNFDQLLGQRFTLDLFESALPRGRLSAEASMSAIAWGYLACFAPDMPFLPKLIKESPGLQRGCLETTLITALPEAFGWSDDGGQFVMGGKPVAVDDIVKRKQDVGDPVLSNLLACINTKSQPSLRVHAYYRVIEYLHRGRVQINATPAQSKSRVEQVRDIAEQVLMLVFAKKLLIDPEISKVLTDIAAIIKETTLERLMSKTPKCPDINQLRDINVWPIQRLYQALDNQEVLNKLAEFTKATEVPEVPEVPEILNSRVKGVNSEVIAQLESLAQRFNEVRGAPTSRVRVALLSASTITAEPVQPLRWDSWKVKLKQKAVLAPPVLDEEDKVKGKGKDS